MIAANAHRVRSLFAAAYPGSPAPKIFRAPGRVNLVGEHTDYNGLSVLPMTIDRAVYLACAPRTDGRLRFASANVEFGPREYDLNALPSASMVQDWTRYLIAVIEQLGSNQRRVGADILVLSDLPAEGGLSSSSALTVAMGLAWLHILGRVPGNPITLAEELTLAERRTGTESGGMDQAVSLLGGESHAVKIDFFPLRVERVPLFKECAFVLCDSLVRANKGGEAKASYNLGPRLGRVMAAMLEAQLCVERTVPVRVERLDDLYTGDIALNHEEVELLFDKVFAKADWTQTSVSTFLSESTGTDTLEALSDLSGLSDLPEPFPLAAMARHQRTEHKRVEMARDAALANDAETFGALMDASHESCARDYNVSCPELDELVTCARNAGALGARLTGAGFGGYTVNLVRNTDIKVFIDKLHTTYYAQWPPSSADPVFVAKPSLSAGEVR